MHTHPSQVVLVVDDHPVCRAFAIEMLDSLGYRAAGVSRLDELVAMCRSRPPSAILIDVEMPGTDGRHFARRLRALQRAGRLVRFSIIGTVALTNPEIVASCQRAGMDACLGKPIEIVRLASELSRLTSSSLLDDHQALAQAPLDDEA